MNQVLRAKQAPRALLGCLRPSGNPWHLLLALLSQEPLPLLCTDVPGNSTDAKHGGLQRQAG